MPQVLQSEYGSCPRRSDPDIFRAGLSCNADEVEHVLQFLHAARARFRMSFLIPLAMVGLNQLNILRAETMLKDGDGQSYLHLFSLRLPIHFRTRGT